MTSNLPISEQFTTLKVFPKHEGVWEGRWIRLDAEGKEIARFTAVLTKRLVDNQWVQTNTYQFADGSSTTQNFVGIITAPGTVEIKGAEPPFDQYRAIAQEHGENLIIFNVWDQATGGLIGTELINLVQPDYCVRTSQGFNPDGSLKSMMMITERKIGE
ncbi:DUF3598 family protein [Kovacikia minuta CCNUW1]|uniref:DUF3598 family protein n=1 Tax=Kovacikia minuta TaxID=2931930 RepID=UPI001CCB4D68|nr:DUF3598 family protein [Kovacikia minuta]UBF24455.1 DUF3598 family protein [Kovacikia minuta CCNUW1]